MRLLSLGMTMVCCGSAGAAISGLNGTVGYQVFTGNAAGEVFLADSFLDFVDGVGSASFASIAPAVVSGGQIGIEVFQVNATTRRVDIVVQSDNAVNGFLSPGTVLSGEFLTFLGWSFGMDGFGDFPGVPNSPFFDPASLGLLDQSTGNAFLTNDAPYIDPAFGPAGLFTAEYAEGSFGGRVFYIDEDAAGNRRDIANVGIARFEASVLYEVVPAPGVVAFGVIGGTLAARRRRA